eukprot:comp12802_c0_seq1/m.7943 comp12802_c0_seq1/g.7943  ORF comp12802_c0_seq1/g.7943 comp12802_c0_seq1/m.7943 type:complete len:200 (-) comp12802_c0_seq1:209-808(-)
MTATLLDTSSMTLHRRVSFSDEPPLVVEVEADPDMDTPMPPPRAKTEAVPVRDSPLFIGVHGESLAPTLAEDLADQKKIEGRLAKTEAKRALLWERLRDLELGMGVAPPTHHRRERKVSFSQETEVIPAEFPNGIDRVVAGYMEEERVRGMWALVCEAGMEEGVVTQTRMVVEGRERVRVLEERQRELKARLESKGATC